MKDAIFKSLSHSFKGYTMTHNGQELSKGYKPDVVLRNKNSYIIFESEHGTSRKHFIGGMVKAAKFLRDIKQGILIFVILEKENTTKKQIANHLIEYFNWINELTNLKDVFVITDEDYCKLKTPIDLKSEEFKLLSLKV